MSEAAIPATDEHGNVQDSHLAPPEIDPYFVKPDGTKVTGTPRGPDGKFLKREQAAEAKPEPPKPVEPEPAEPKDEPEAAKPKAEAKPDEEKDAEEQKKQTIGDAWREVKAARREIAARQASFEAAHAEAESAKQAFEAEKAEMRANFRGWLAKNGLSFRELVEAELKEQDQDPKEREIRELKAAQAELQAKLDALANKDQELTATQQRQAEIAEVAEVIAANAEQFPYLAAYKPGAAELVKHWHDHKKATGVALDAFELFDNANKILAEQAEALAPVYTGNGKQAAEAPATAARAESRVGSPAAEAPEETPQTAASTLTNRTAAQRASAVAQSLSAEERARRIGATMLKFRTE